MKIPSIPQGKGFLGPEFFGCCGTGMRPAIFHSKNGKWIIGPEIYARMVIERAGHYSNKRKHRFNTRLVHVLKSRVTAIKRFQELCTEVETWNETQRLEYNSAHQDAQKGDIAAALKVGMF